MLTLSLSDLDRLTKGQREALSGFILSFNSPHAQARDRKAIDDAFAPNEPTPSEEIELTPEAAFGNDDTFKSITGAPAAQAATSGLDKSGLPWDERIHSSSKAFNADGTWRKKRGVSDALVAEVELQLKALMAVPSPVHVQTSPFPEVALASVPAPPAEVVPFPVASPVPLPPDFDPKAAFINFIKRSADAVREKKITQAEVESICGKHGVASIPLLGNRLDLVPTIAIEVETLIASR